MYIPYLNNKNYIIFAKAGSGFHHKILPQNGIFESLLLAVSENSGQKYYKFNYDGTFQHFLIIIFLERGANNVLVRILVLLDKLIKIKIIVSSLHLLLVQNLFSLNSWFIDGL